MSIQTVNEQTNEKSSPKNISRPILLIILLISIVGISIFLIKTLFIKSANVVSVPQKSVNITSVPLASENSFPITQGHLLGQRPIITGAMGWTVGAFKGREVFFQKVKNIGISHIRLMHVLNVNADWAKLDYAIDSIEKNGQDIVLCLGNLASPPIDKKEIDQNAKTLSAMIEHLISIYGIEKVNTFPIELSNEYGAKNFTYLINSYYTAIKSEETSHSGLSLRIIAPSSQRGDYDNFDRALNFLHDQQIPLFAVSAHYYLRGARKDTPSDLPFSQWLNRIKQITAKYGYDKLPLYVDEYGLDGKHTDEQLKESYNAAWIASRLGDTSYYTNDAITYFISGVYGQPYTFNGGWLGLFVGYGGSQAPYPIEREFELEQRLGTNSLYSVNGIPSDRTNIGGVTDGKDNWLLWNMSNQSIKLRIPASSERIVGYIDEQNGNSNTIMSTKTMKQSFWQQPENISLLENRSDPFHDPHTGIARPSVKPINGEIVAILKEQGVVFIGTP